MFRWGGRNPPHHYGARPVGRPWACPGRLLASLGMASHDLSRPARRKDIIDDLAGSLGSRAAAGRALDAVTAAIINRLAAGQSVRIKGFGSISPRVIPARRVRHPVDGRGIRVGPTAGATLSPSSRMRHAIATGRALPLPSLADEGLQPIPTRSGARLARALADPGTALVYATETTAWLRVTPDGAGAGGVAP